MKALREALFDMVAAFAWGHLTSAPRTPPPMPPATGKVERRAPLAIVLQTRPDGLTYITVKGPR